MPFQPGRTDADRRSRGRRRVPPPADTLRAALVAASLCAWTGHAAAGGEVVGRPRVVDAGTLDFSGQVVHLFGIDAPSAEQTCQADGGGWPCGRDARWAAINRIHPHWVTCVEKGRRADGGFVAVCYLAGKGQHDLGDWLVRHGWATADRTVSQDYVEAEAAARTAGRGLWR